jgi:hypothetical protein
MRGIGAIHEFTAVLVTNPNGLKIWMPTTEDFDKIRFHIATTSHGGGRLAQAYMNEGRLSLMPSDTYVPCIKAIYQMTAFDPNRKIYVDKPVGNWIYDEACKCMEKTVGEGRLDLGDGFVVPSSEEQASITTMVMTQGYTLYNAIQKICPNITPPLEAVGCIENSIKSTNWQYYDIYRACRATYIEGQATLPKPNGNGETPKAVNTMLYVIAGLVLLLLLSKKT